MKELKVSALEEGTVIDHIPTKNTFKVVWLLKLAKHEDIVLIATNLTSKRLGKKGLIKISGKQLTQEEANKLALVAPDATINIIKNTDVIRKIKVQLPSELINVARCYNPSCITNNDVVISRLMVENRKPLLLRCHYCERSMTEQDVELV
ncbi:MAG: aspartate carbamoyltransferase regulatory subunit [Nanoarchaeota archaeon]